MKYPHWLSIGAPGVGSVASEGGNPDTDEWVEGSAAAEPTAVPVYDGPADVQDTGKAVVYGQDLPAGDSQATAFLEDESRIHEIEPGMIAVATWNKDTPEQVQRDATVSEVTVLDGTVGLRWL